MGTWSGPGFGENRSDLEKSGLFNSIVGEKTFNHLIKFVTLYQHPFPGAIYWIVILGSKDTVGANKDIANQEIILSFGPRTFWRRDEIPKWNFTILAQETYQQWEDISLHSHCFCQWLTSQIHKHICCWFIWEMMRLKPYVTFSSDMFPIFNNNIAFIEGRILWAFAVDIDWHYVTANLLMNVLTCLYWNQMTVASLMCPPVLEDLFRQGD